ncbi:MAG: Rdx family protein [Anaerolineales bacterium]|nr:Rdx family protein [Anaerolineales bacterium]
MGAFGRDLAALTLIPSEGGRFEVTLDDTLIFSKQAAGRHTTSAEIIGLIKGRGVSGSEPAAPA